MKKWFALTHSFLLCAILVCGVTHAEGPLKSFIDLVVSHKHQFVCDKNRDRLTDEFDIRIMPKRVSKSVYTALYHDAVKKILESGGEVKYNCRVLAAWALCELRSRGVKCKDLTIALYKRGEGKISYHAAVLIPCNRNGVKEWYVCDISAMSEFQDLGFVFIELKHYVSMYGKYFIGIAVNDDEYAQDCIDLEGNTFSRYIAVRDITAWLVTDGGDVNSAIDVLRSQRTRKLKIMSSPSTMGMDADIVMGVAALYAPDLALKGFECAEV